MKVFLTTWIAIQVLAVRIGIGQCSLQAFFHREEGKHLANSVVRTEQTDSELDCGALCSREISCVSVNYKNSGENQGMCELNDRSLEESQEDGREMPEFIYVGVVERTCDEPGDMCPSKNVNRSCSELQSKSGTRENGEYELHLSFPRCEKAVTVYCDDMDTPNPREYITLKAGEDNNFSKHNFVGGVWQDNRPSSTSKFSKIRILPDLTVVCDDFKFSRITWSYNGAKNISFAFGGDCHDKSCNTIKKVLVVLFYSIIYNDIKRPWGACAIEFKSKEEGLFKMDITGTGLRFVTPISWKFSGWPDCQGQQPIDYEVDESSQVVSGNCGGYPGECQATNLALEIIECGN